MLFSILIAHFNNWKYFLECYQSIKNQTYINIEIVIVDDCSSDDSYDRLEKLAEADLSIKLFRNSKNRGVGYTKSKCIEKASGAILGFLDPDDSINPKAIERSMEEYIKDPTIIATYSQIMMCDDNLQFLNIYSRTRKVNNGCELFFNINNEVSHFFTFKKEAYLKTNGINPELTSSVDFDLYLKLYEVGDFKYIKEPLYFYRQHDAGVSQNKKKRDSVKRNWNKVLYDTCVRRGIIEIGAYKITNETNLSKIIFDSENDLISRIKRKLNII